MSKCERGSVQSVQSLSWSVRRNRSMTLIRVTNFSSVWRLVLSRVCKQNELECANTAAALRKAHKCTMANVHCNDFAFIYTCPEEGKRASRMRTSMTQTTEVDTFSGCMQIGDFVSDWLMGHLHKQTNSALPNEQMWTKNQRDSGNFNFGLQISLVSVWWCPNVYLQSISNRCNKNDTRDH